MDFTEKQKSNFWKKVDKTDSCWIWTAGLQHGYGRFHVNYKNYFSHRISWFLAGNVIPEGHLIRHKCRNRNCVNPDHIETGTNAENCADKVRDGTDMKGEKHHKAKLTSEQVLEIRARAEENQRELAEEYVVSKSTIHYIIARRIWKHL